MIHRQYKILIWVMLLQIIAVSCVDEYWPDLGNKYEEVLVIDAVLTDNPGPYYVKLSLSTGLDFPVYNPVLNAEVAIVDNLGNSENLSETEPGTYITTSPDYTGIIGRQYILQIHTQEGKYYESEYEALTAPVQIDSVYGEIEYYQSADANHDYVGYQFYLDTDIPDQDTNYYFWRLTATYEFNSDYYIRFIYDHGLFPFPDPDSLFTCWTTNRIEKLYTYKTEDLSEPKLERIPLNYVTTESRELSVRYSLLVDQYTLGTRA